MRTAVPDDRIGDDAEFLYAGLQEPSKAEVLAWRPGQPFGRRAKVHFWTASNRAIENTDVVLWHTIG